MRWKDRLYNYKNSVQLVIGRYSMNSSRALRKLVKEFLKKIILKIQTLILQLLLTLKSQLIKS